MYEVIITSLVLIFAIVAIITQKIPTIAVGMAIPFLLSVFQVIPAETAFSGLGSKNTFLIIGALVIGDACFRTGLTDLIGEKMVRISGRLPNESCKLLIIGLIAGLLSAFLSSFAVQIAFLSLIMVMADALQISKTRALMALGFSATVGGTWSIIGTTVMIMAKSSYESAVPGDTMGMFEMTKVSLPVGLAVIIFYCLFTSRYLPDRSAAVSQSIENKKSGEKRAFSARDCTITAMILAGFIILVALDGMIPVSSNMVTVLALFLLVIMKIATVEDILKAINWDVIIFIVGVTVLSDAMVSSGLSQKIGSLIVAMIGKQASTYAVIGIVAIVSIVLTQLMSNSGAFGVILPFLPVIAESLDVALKPLLIAAALACSCGFCLPLAAPSYLILASEGNIRTGDWLKQGLPLLAISVLLIIYLVPKFWPL